MKSYRISAAGIVLHDNKILLVRYKSQDESSILVGPGGGVELEEDMQQALVREVLEETGLEVKPGKMLFVEDLLSRKYRMIKIWFLCCVVGGQLLKTPEAAVEGIIDVNWYSKDQLKNEVVYPSIIMEPDWNTFEGKCWETKYLALTQANF
ncbi:MAG: NUDIX domain-containing protein [bacterium]